MDDAGQGQVPSVSTADKTASSRWRFLWILAHLAVVYAIVKFCTPWLAGWTRGWLLPFLERPTSSGSFEFLFSHLLAFSFVPAFLAGLINTRFKHKAAQFVWGVSAAVLAYKLIVFPVTTSVLARESGAAFHYYFAGEFLIPEYHNWAEFRDIAGSFDMMRGMAQLSFTAPFYAGVGYSLAAWIEIRAELHLRFSEKLRKWEESRFDHRNDGSI